MTFIIFELNENVIDIEQKRTLGAALGVASEIDIDFARASAIEIDYRADHHTSTIEDLRCTSDIGYAMATIIVIDKAIAIVLVLLKHPWDVDKGVWMVVSKRAMEDGQEWGWGATDVIDGERTKIYERAG